MKDIAIYGAGGFGREVACLLRRINVVTPTWHLVGFYDDGKQKGESNEYGEVLGGMDELNAVDTPLSVVMAIGSPKTVATLVGRIQNEKIDFPNIFSPDTVFLDKENISWGRGNLVCSGCLFSCNVQIGDFNAFNGLITVGHDATIGNFNSFMPAVRISGETNVGNENYFGVSSILLQKKNVGSNTIIGAGCVIIRSTKDNSTYIGNPATILKF